MAMLQASREEAMLAVNMYNDSTQPRAFEGFVVHMHLAWLYLLQAKFTRDKVDFRYRQRDHPRQFERIDGEIKCWELAKCVKENWPNESDATRKNIEFFIGLRNKIEHRHMHSHQNLIVAVSGKAHAFLRNFDNETVEIFGVRHSLASTVRFPLFLGAFSHAGTESLLKLQASLPADLQSFIAQFEADLTQEVQDDPKFEMRLKVFLEKGSKNAADLAMHFVNWDDLSEEEQGTIAAMGRDGRTIIRERVREVVNHGLVKPGVVCANVAPRIPFRFGQHEHCKAYLTQGIRPAGNDTHPERTLEQYCRYDEPNRSYLYTQAWIERIVEHCQTPEGFRAFVGIEPKQPPQVDQHSLDEAEGNNETEDEFTNDVSEVVAAERFDGDGSSRQIYSMPSFPSSSTTIE